MDPITPTIWWENSALWSAVAACISAFFAGLTIYFTNKKSTREMIDIVKADILVLTSDLDGRRIWKETSDRSQQLEGGGRGPRIQRFADLLATKRKKKKRDKRYLRGKWIWIIPAAMEELRKEGYKWI